MTVHGVADFWSQVGTADVDGCRAWLGPRSDGYGTVYVSGAGNIQAHRLAYLYEFGLIPTGLSVRHACDNRVCVEPTHLTLGTPADNGRDRADRGRSRNAHTSVTLGKVAYSK